MSYSKYIFTLDLRSVESQMALQVTQGDTNRELVISFSDGGKPVVLANGSIAMMSIVRPTGTVAQEPCEIEEGGTYVVYTFSKYTCPVVGLHKCQIVIYNAEGKQIAAPKFAINASAKLVDGDDVIIPDEDVAVLDAIYLAETERQTYYVDFKKRVDAGEFDGQDVTHEWDGTNLVITSASGTSSANLQGAPGPKGDTYVITEKDKAEIIAAVLEPIPNGDEVKY